MPPVGIYVTGIAAYAFIIGLSTTTFPVPSHRGGFHDEDTGHTRIPSRVWMPRIGLEVSRGALWKEGDALPVAAARANETPIAQSAQRSPITTRP